MGRRSTKSSPAPGAALPFDTVGVTILPGVSLPEWAETPGGAATPPGPELIADAGPTGMDVFAEAAAPAPAPASVAPSAEPDWAGAPPASSPPPTGQAARAPEPAFEPAFAMAGAALVGASAGAAAGYGQPAPGYAPEPSRYPAAPGAGIAAAPVPPAYSAAPAAQGYAPTAPPAPAYGQGWAATPPPTPVASPDPVGDPTTAWPVPDPTPAAPEAVGPDPMIHAMTGTTAPPAPSQAGSPEGATLSPQHVALLSWWADMMAAGQFPAPATAPGPNESLTTPTGEPRKRSGLFKAAGVGLVAVAAVGAAALVGPKLLAADEPVVVPVTEVTMPSMIGELVAITDPAIGEELEPLLGFGLRPAGVTVTNAYGPAADGPLAVAAMATTMGAPAEAVGQIAAWAERTGATVAPSVAGTGANEGITCAAVEALPEGEPGSFCVWTASGTRGQTYSVAMSVEDAQTLTDQVRTSIAGA